MKSENLELIFRGDIELTTLQVKRTKKSHRDIRLKTSTLLCHERLTDSETFATTW